MATLLRDRALKSLSNSSRHHHSFQNIVIASESVRNTGALFLPIFSHVSISKIFMKVSCFVKSIHSRSRTILNLSLNIFRDSLSFCRRLRIIFRIDFVTSALIISLSFGFAFDHISSHRSYTI